MARSLLVIGWRSTSVIVIARRRVTIDVTPVRQPGHIGPGARMSITSRMRFRLLTYNIHKGIGGLDRRYDLRASSRRSPTTSPTSPCCRKSTTAPRGRSSIASATCWPRRSPCPTAATSAMCGCKIGHYGNALLSRFPLSDVVDLDLTIPFKKRRAALIARFHVAGRRAHAHRGHRQRASGPRGVRAHDPAPPAAGHRLPSRARASTTPLIIGGDFNDVYGNLGRRVMQPAGFELASGHGRTFPAAAPLRRLDRVFFRGNLHAMRGLRGSYCTGPPRVRSSAADRRFRDLRRATTIAIDVSRLALDLPRLPRTACRHAVAISIH